MQCVTCTVVDTCPIGISHTFKMAALSVPLSVLGADIQGRLGEMVQSDVSGAHADARGRTTC
uniref:Uncharacterized protein n=1 Tax=Anguilla anguilla TaxID=7936 RepID=A0A0E9PUU5_ANGAN